MSLYCVMGHVVFHLPLLANHSFLQKSAIVLLFRVNNTSVGSVEILPPLKAEY